MPQNAAEKKSPPPGGSRPTKAEEERRLAEVEALLASGAPRREVVGEMWERHRMPERTVADYIARVHARWVDAGKETRPFERERTEARLHTLAMKLEKERAWTALVQVERLLADVRGVRAPQKLDVTTVSPAPPPPEMTLEQAEEGIVSLVRVAVYLAGTGRFGFMRELKTAARDLAIACGYPFNPGTTNDNDDDTSVTSIATTNGVTTENGGHEVVPTPLPPSVPRTVLRVVNATGVHAS